MAKTTDVVKILDKRDSKDPEMQALLLQAYRFTSAWIHAAAEPGGP